MSCDCYSSVDLPYSGLVCSVSFRFWYFLIILTFITGPIWAPTPENLSSEVCEQHRHRPACTSAQSDQRFVICFLKSFISRLATSEISIFHLVFVADEIGLSLALSETPKTGLVTPWPI